MIQQIHHPEEILPIVLLLGCVCVYVCVFVCECEFVCVCVCVHVSPSHRPGFCPEIVWALAQTSSGLLHEAGLSRPEPAR